MEYISLQVAFDAGLLSFLSPCVLPLVPLHLASLRGSVLPDTKQSAAQKYNIRGIIPATFFIDKMA